MASKKLAFLFFSWKIKAEQENDHNFHNWSILQLLVNVQKAREGKLRWYVKCTPQPIFELNENWDEWSLSCGYLLIRKKCLLVILSWGNPLWESLHTRQTDLLNLQILRKPSQHYCRKGSLLFILWDAFKPPLWEQITVGLTCLGTCYFFL